MCGLALTNKKKSIGYSSDGGCLWKEGRGKSQLCRTRSVDITLFECAAQQLELYVSGHFWQFVSPAKFEMAQLQQSRPMLLYYSLHGQVRACGRKLQSSVLFRNRLYYLSYFLRCLGLWSYHILQRRASLLVALQEGKGWTRKRIIFFTEGGK